MTTLRLAVGHNETMMWRGMAPGLEPVAAILCSYYYADRLDKLRHRMQFRDWSMDSGAFTAHYQGVTIDLAQYTEDCQRRLATDPALAEVFTLDALDDPDVTRRNTEHLWAHGVPAVPVYHYGEPEKYLLHYAAEYPKIALGGVARLSLGRKVELVNQVFARVWPKLMHGLAVTGPVEVLAAPWHSVDSSSWEAPGRYDKSRALAGGKVQHVIQGGRRMRNKYQEVCRLEVEWYLRLEAQAAAKWAPRLAEAMDEARTHQLPDGTFYGDPRAVRPQVMA